jgi:hypothetical protein
MKIVQPVHTASVRTCDGASLSQLHDFEAVVTCIPCPHELLSLFKRHSFFQTGNVSGLCRECTGTALFSLMFTVSSS